MRQIWGSVSVNDHLRTRAFVAEVLLFDRVIVPVAPADDEEEQRRWRLKRWNPRRQRQLLDILGDGPTDKDLAVAVPWTQSKRDQFQSISSGNNNTSELRSQRQKYLKKLEFDSQLLKSADAYHLTRMILTREYDSEEESYAKRLPHADVEAVVPAYSTFKDADRELDLNVELSPKVDAAGELDTAPNASLIGWSLLVPADSAWSDAQALERAADLARSDDYREARDEFRNWWRLQMLREAQPRKALDDLVGRADRLNEILKAQQLRTRTLRSFAVLGGVGSIAGVWFPPVAVVGAALALVGIGGEWLWHNRDVSPSHAPAAMFTDARRHFGMR